MSAAILAARTGRKRQLQKPSARRNLGEEPWILVADTSLGMEEGYRFSKKEL